MNGCSLKYWASLGLLMMSLVLAGPSLAAMAISSSENYQLTETEFGAGSAVESCSGQYCARATIGDISSSGGEVRSPGYATFSDFSADDEEPRIEVIIEPGESNLGVLSTDTTASKETVIKILSYLSEGYTLQLVGDPPKYQDHVLKTPLTPTDSKPGTEQFAINLAKNDIPVVGAEPVQVPSNEFSFGVVENNYKTANKFMFNSGEVIAGSSSESGQTEYTISMIVNIANSTPAGHFVGEYAALIVPVF